MLDRKEARYRVLEYVLDLVSEEQIEETSFITDLSETEEDAKLLRSELGIYEREIQQQILDLENSHLR